MIRAKAPKGLHTEVDIKVRLKNGRSFEENWETPLALAPAYHKALKWLMEGLIERNIQGRSRVHRIQIDVRYEEGDYVHEDT